jgi:hypothetical protein
MLAGAVIAVAQDPAPGVVTPVDTFVVIVPARPVEEISKDIEVLQMYRARAKVLMEDAKTQVLKIESLIDLKEKELKLLESRMEAAEKEKREAEAAALKSQTEGVERIQELLGLRKEMHEASIAAAEAVVAYVGAAEDTYEQEIVLAKKRGERTAQAGSGGAAAALAITDQRIREMETDLLNSQSATLSKQETSISRQEDLVEARQKLAAAQAALIAK